MNNTVLLCPICNINFTKQTKEITRQIKKNPNRIFYCSLNCSGKISSSHLLKWHFPLNNKIRKNISGYSKYNNEEKPFVEYNRRCKNRSYRKKRKVIEYDVDVQYLMEVWEKQKGLCAWSNIQLVHGGKNINLKASLDRIDSSLGYIKGNVQFVSCALNYAKSSEPDSSIYELLSLIRNT